MTTNSKQIQHLIDLQKEIEKGLNSGESDRTVEDIIKEKAQQRSS